MLIRCTNNGCNGRFLAELAMRHQTGSMRMVCPGCGASTTVTYEDGELLGRVVKARPVSVTSVSVRGMQGEKRGTGG